MSVPREWAELGAQPSSGDPETWLAQFREQAEALNARAQEAQRAMAENKATVQNKLVRVVVGTGGMVDELTFLPAATAASATQLTTAVHDAYTEACAQVTRNALAAMSGLVDEDDPSLQLMRESVPQSVVDRMAEDEEKEGR